MAARGGWGDAVRMSVGTLTVLPVRPPASVDRTVAGRAMVLAPVVGLVLGLTAGLVLFLARTTYDARLAAAITIAALALATRGLHLDGLADTADALGASRNGRSAALEVMRRGDIGPFGAVTLTLVLILQVLALGEAVLQGYGTLAVVSGCVVGRLAGTWACTTGIPAARPDGLGAAVAGTVPRIGAAVMTGLALALGAVAGGFIDDDAGVLPALLVVGAIVGGLALSGLLLWRCLRRFGGVTGDVLGALVEIGALGAMLVLAH